MKNVLITGAGGSSSIYLAEKLAKHYHIVLADADPNCAGLHAGYQSVVIPLANNPNFISQMVKIIHDLRIDFAVPCVDEEQERFWQIKSLCPKLKLVQPNLAFIQLALNKKKLMKKLHNLQISEIETYRMNNLKFPLVAKPIHGRGSRGFAVISTKSQLSGYLKFYQVKAKDILLQKYIPGDEYTVSVIVNNKNQLIGIVPKKIIVKRGITRISVSEHNQAINNVCIKIVNLLKPAGIINVQLKYFNNQVYVFEINPRLSTTTVHTDHVYGNEIKLFIDNYDKEVIHPNLNFKENIVMARYESCIFYENK